MHFPIHFRPAQGLSALVRALGALLAACAFGAFAAGSEVAPPDGTSAAQPADTTGRPPSTFCGQPKKLTLREQDRVLQFATVVRQELERSSGSAVALVGRSGLDLSRFHLRYSHGGVLIREGTGVPWSVRQLYYDCAVGHPRLYDQGLAGYFLSAEAPDLAFVSVVLLPSDAAAALRTAALDQPLAARLLASTYSANAYPFSTRYQNCNQWTVELLAAAWGGLDNDAVLRRRAQDWLVAHGYNPPPVNVGSHLVKFVASFMPLIHLDDHPPDVQLGLDFQFSLPEGIESFVHTRLPAARRIEFCHDTEKTVIHHGWKPLGAGCEAGAGDQVVAMDG